MHFLAYYISALREYCALKFLHALDIDQDYLAHTPTGVGSPKKFLSRKLKNGPKIHRVRLDNFRASGSILMELFSVDALRGRGNKLGTIYTMPSPKNLWRPKNRPNFFAIFDNFWLWSRISPERINVSKIGKFLIIYNTSHVRGKKNLANFGPQTKKLLTLINVQPYGLFSGDYISAIRLGGAAPWNFLYALEIDQGYLAHTPTGTLFPPPQKKIVKIKNLA